MTQAIKIFLYSTLIFSCSEQYSKYSLPSNNTALVEDQVYGYSNMNEALVDYPNSQQLVIQKLKAHKSNNWNGVTEDEIKQFVQNNIQNAHINQLASEYFLTINNIEEALKMAVSAEALGANSASFYENKSLIFSRLEKYTEAIDYINKAILLNRSDYRSYYTKGKIYLNLKDTVSAIKYMNLSLNHDSNNYQVLYEIAGLFAKTNKLYEAEKLILDAINNKPNEEKLKLKYSEILLSQGKSEQARTVLKKIFYADSMSINSGLMLSGLYFNLKYYDSTILISDRILSFDTVNLGALKFKAQAFHKKGFYNSSIANYELIISQDSLFENAKEELEKVLANRAYLQKLKDRRAAMPVFDIVAPRKKLNN